MGDSRGAHDHPLHGRGQGRHLARGGRPDRAGQGARFVSSRWTLTRVGDTTWPAAGAVGRNRERRGAGGSQGRRDPFGEISRFDLSCEWGEAGLSALRSVSDVVVIIDVLSFCTCVDIAVRHLDRNPPLPLGRRFGRRVRAAPRRRVGFGARQRTLSRSRRRVTWTPLQGRGSFFPRPMERPSLWLPLAARSLPDACGTLRQWRKRRDRRGSELRSFRPASGGRMEASARVSRTCLVLERSWSGCREDALRRPGQPLPRFSRRATTCARRFANVCPGAS